MPDYNFSNIVTSEFKFLEDEYGFNLTHISINEVVYQSQVTNVRITFDNYSFDLDAYIGLAEASKYGFANYYSIEQIMKCQGVVDVGNGGIFQVTSEEAMLGCNHRLADFIRGHGIPALLGDIGAYNMLKQCAQQEFELFQVNSVRNKAQLAYQQSNYKEAAQLYSSIGQHLTPAESKRLTYLYKKLDKTS